MSTYTTIQGDMWDSIAYKVYGSVSCLDQLIEANPAWRSQYIFPAGIEVNIPEPEKPITADDFPPWKKVSG